MFKSSCTCPEVAVVIRLKYHILIYLFLNTKSTSATFSSNTSFGAGRSAPHKAFKISSYFPHSSLIVTNDCRHLTIRYDWYRSLPTRHSGTNQKQNTKWVASRLCAQHIQQKRTSPQNHRSAEGPMLLGARSFANDMMQAHRTRRHRCPVPSAKHDTYITWTQFFFKHVGQSLRLKVKRRSFLQPMA